MVIEDVDIVLDELLSHGGHDLFLDRLRPCFDACAAALMLTHGCSDVVERLD